MLGAFIKEGIDRAYDGDGAYFIYNMACSEDDSEGVAEGATILVTGFKIEWEGEIEIIDATFEFTDLVKENPMAPVDLIAGTVPVLRVTLST